MRKRGMGRDRRVHNWIDHEDTSKRTQLPKFNTLYTIKFVALQPTTLALGIKWPNIHYDSGQ